MLSASEGMDLTEYECPICTEYLWPPIYTCNNGHSLCRKCINKVRICPICRENLPVPKVKDKALAATLTRQRFPCEFSWAGCIANVKLCNMEQHKKICKFRTGRHCAYLGFPNCQTMTSMSELIHHARSAHDIPCVSIDLLQDFEIEQITRSGNTRDLKKVDWKPVFIFVDVISNILQLRTAFHSGTDDDRKIRWTIQHTAAGGTDYISVISFIKDRAQRYCETWTGPVLRHDDNLENMNSWFILPSTLIEGKSGWKLRIHIKPGSRIGPGVRPACISINEVLNEPELAPGSSTVAANRHPGITPVLRGDPRGSMPPPNSNLTHTSAPSTFHPSVPVEPRPSVAVEESPRLRTRQTCAICGQYPIPVPIIMRPIRYSTESGTTFWMTLTYCQNCFNDSHGRIAEIFYAIPGVNTELEAELRRMEYKRGIYGEHFYVVPSSASTWPAVRRLLRLVFSSDGWLGVRCDGCSAPILGWRFQCTECFNLNFCRRCYLESKKHGWHTVLVTSTRRFGVLLKQRLIWMLVVACLFQLLQLTGTPTDVPEYAFLERVLVWILLFVILIFALLILPLEL